ncbi:hypothetical protein GBA65_01160 [Rubrobacter marinus]|uniref:Uncharacterized protein n=1 Tax=Rubrobacter marinus TaxID=2653852 RepID=A0A6G8PT22_9ACTN|nr:efflux RND transporter permease subunit [Rubrobacter marinus]QIN77347.1 hypothetical protein GBA65_01160 [Rubrobacter marinus]
MSRIVSWCLRNKSVVFLATLLLIGSGVFATTRLNQELLPDIEFPIITISTPVPGAGPETVDETVTQPLESAITGVENLEGVQANSAQGFSVVIAEFSLDADTEEAEAELQSAIEGVGLPEQALEPEVRRQSASEFPIMNVSLAAGDGDLAALTTYTEDEVVPRIEEVDGIGRVDVVGGSEERIEVELDPAALEENGLPAAAVVGAIQGANANSPVGSVEVEGLSTPVRVASEVGDVEALRNLPISAAAGAAPGGASGGAPSGGAPPGAAAGAPAGASQYAAAPPAPVTLGEIADVRVADANLSGIARTNGEPSLGLNITKAPDANTVDVAAGVEEALAGAREELGEDQVQVVFNSAEDVKESINSLIEEAAIGALLAIFVIFFFLRSLRATLVTAVSLPTSVLAALLFSWGYDLTLNILTLAGLTIAVGRVVDDAIVVLENSYRYVQQGYDPEEAALRGTTEVASAITSSTLTTTAVFLPLAVVGGIVSKFFVPLSLTVALALLASLIVSITIIPVLVSVFIRREGAGRASREHDGSAQDSSNEDAPDARPGSRRARRAERGGGGGLLRVLVGGIVLLVASAVAFVVAARAGLLDGVPGVPAGLLDAATGLDLGSLAVIATAAVLATLLVVGIVLLAARASRRSSERPSGDGEDGFLVRLYTPMLRWALRHRAAVLVLALVVFVGGLAAIPFLPVSFFPAGEERIAQARVELPPGAGLQQTDEAVRPFEEFLQNDPDVRNYQISIAGEDNFDPNSPIRSANQAQAFINIEEEAEPQETIQRISAEGREIFGEEQFQAEILQNGPPQGELQAIITGGTEAEREDAAGIVTDEISSINSVINVRSDVSGGTPRSWRRSTPRAPRRPASPPDGLGRPRNPPRQRLRRPGGGAPGGAPGAPAGRRASAGIRSPSACPRGDRHRGRGPRPLPRPRPHRRRRRRGDPGRGAGGEEPGGRGARRNGERPHRLPGHPDRLRRGPDGAGGA